MVTTFGDLRHESAWQAGTMDPDMARKRTPGRPGDADAHLPHEAVGLLVAQALNWDPQQIVEAFTIALKQVSEKRFFTRSKGTRGKPNRLSILVSNMRRPRRVQSDNSRCRLQLKFRVTLLLIHMTGWMLRASLAIRVLKQLMAGAHRPLKR